MERAGGWSEGGPSFSFPLSGPRVETVPAVGTAIPGRNSIEAGCAIPSFSVTTKVAPPPRRSHPRTAVFGAAQVVGAGVGTAATAAVFAGSDESNSTARKIAAISVGVAAIATGREPEHHPHRADELLTEMQAAQEALARIRATTDARNRSGNAGRQRSRRRRRDERVTRSP